MCAWKGPVPGSTMTLFRRPLQSVMAEPAACKMRCSSRTGSLLEACWKDAKVWYQNWNLVAKIQSVMTDRTSCLLEEVQRCHGRRNVENGFVLCLGGNFGGVGRNVGYQGAED